MLKGISKKVLALLFIVAVMFGFTNPMFYGYPCKQPSTEKKIIDVPDDCLREIFIFYGGKDAVSIFPLRIVSKNFNQAILEMVLSLPICCRDNNICDVSPFCKFGKVTGLLERLKHLHTFEVSQCKGFDDEKLKYLTTLISLLVWNCNNFIGNGVCKLKGLRRFKVCCCDNFTNVGMVKSLHSFEVNDCSKFTGGFNLENLRSFKTRNCSDFTGVGLENSKQVHTLSVRTCSFEGVELKYLENLHTFEIDWCDEFDFEKLKNLTSLLSFEANDCDKFTGAELKNLESLRSLTVKNCKNFNEDSVVIKQLKKNGCKVKIDDLLNQFN